MAALTRREVLREGVIGLGALAGADRRAGGADEPQPIRLGIIGLDTVHVTVFTKLFNRDPQPLDELRNIRVSAAFPAGNPDFPLSRDRLENFTREVRGLGVEIVDSLDALLERVDGVLLESVDGRQHLEQARPVFARRKPVFIDKPLAASLSDVLAIAQLGERHETPWFTASSSRFTAGYPELRQEAELGGIRGCDVYSQSRAAPGHPDLFWYGVHGVDLLYSLLGTGCGRVTAVQTATTEQVTGVWTEDRVGTFRGIREHTAQTGLGATVFGERAIRHVNNYYDYQPLVQAIARFFRTGRSPIPVPEMVEVFAFLAAAEASKRSGGVPVELTQVLAEAGREAP